MRPYHAIRNPMLPDPRLLRRVRRAGRARGWLALTIALGLAAAVAFIGAAALLSGALDAAIFGGADLAALRPALAGFLALALARALALWGSEAAGGRLAALVKEGLRDDLVGHLAALGPRASPGGNDPGGGDSEKEAAGRSGALLHDLVDGVEALDGALRHVLPQLALAALAPLAVLVVIFPVDRLTGLVLLLTAPLIPLFMVLIGRLAEARSRRQWRALSRMSAYFLDVIQGLTTLKMLNRSRDQIAVIARIGDRFRRATLDVLRVAFLSALVLEWLSTLSVAVVAVEIGLRLLGGGLPFRQAMFILLLAPEFYLPLRLLGSRFHAGIGGVAAAERLFAILQTPPAVPTPPYPAPPPSGPPEIRLEDVTVDHGVGEPPALDGVSLRLPAGSRTLLVGPSGAGKSTLADLLLRFAAPTAGRITVDGVDLAALDPDAWRARIAWVPQHPYLFDESVAANIARGRPGAPPAAIEAAARAAGAHDFIAALPDGYATRVGERGARLSGGQAQRLALARAFLQDAPVLILDEAAAHLDPLTSASLHATLDRLTHGRTTLIITHQPEAVAGADQVAVLREGRLVQVGPPAETLVTPSASGDPVPPSPAPEPTTTVGPLEGELPARPGRTLWRLLGLYRAHAPRMALAVTLGAATVASGVALMATAGYIIARAAERPSIAAIQLGIVGVRFFGISRGGLRYLERLVSHDATFRLLARLRVWFYGALEPLAPARLWRYQSGDLLARIVADIAALEDFYVRALAPPLVALVVWLALGLSLLPLSVAVAAAVAGPLLLAGVGVPWLSGHLERDASKRDAPKRDAPKRDAPKRDAIALRARLNAALVDYVQGLADLLALGGAGAQRARLAALSHSLEADGVRRAALDGLAAGLIGLLAHLAVALGLALALPLARAGALDAVWLAALALGTLAAFEAVSGLPGARRALATGLAAGERLFELVDAEPAVRDPAGPSPAPRDASLRLQDVRFAYGPGEPPALDGVSFALPPGGRLAVVGPSGAGKSTLVNLLLRFYPLGEGQILLGGHPLAAYHQEDVRRLIAVVPQRPYLFAGTVRDNLRLARPDADEAALEAAVRAARLGDFIAGLPGGYDTWIGEGGARLSGGERGRLALARALLRDAPIVVLDEPTASLDRETERALLADLDLALRGRTVLLITHRPAPLALVAEAGGEVVTLRAGRRV